jgi:hypothetical protein
MGRALLIFAVLAVGSAALPVASQELTGCVAGQQVIDREGKTGIIVANHKKLCQVRYTDGQIYQWIYWNLRPAADPSKLGPVKSDAAPSAGSPGLTILRPSSSHTLVYRADPRGHFNLTATVNGAPVRFVLDTGASLVALTLDDARAAGIARSELVFNQRTKRPMDGSISRQ